MQSFRSRIIAMKEDNREAFRKAIFNVVEYLTKYELSHTGQKLIIHYFNDSRESDAFLRAIAAIDKYIPESMPPQGERPEKLMKLLRELKRQAVAWDASDAE